MKFGRQSLPQATDIWNRPGAWRPIGGYGMYSEDSKAGKNITVHKALQVSSFSAGVRMISQTLGMMPIKMHRRIDEQTKAVYARHPLYEVLHDRPNPFMTAAQWKRFMTANAILRGNAYSKIEWDGSMVRQLVPLNSDAMRIEYEDNGLPVYLYYENTDKEQRFPSDHILHLANFSPDGLLGLSTVWLARETLGLALALEEHAARYFSNGAELGGTLEAPEGVTVDDDTARRIEESFRRKNSGVDKHHNWAFLENGLKANRLGMTNVESQFIEARSFIIAEIARHLNLRQHTLGLLDRAIKSNIEQMGRELLMFDLLPWVVEWEQVIQRDLILAPDRYFAEFTVDMLLRGDTKSRWEAYKVALEYGVMSPNEVRAKESMNPRGDGRGDRYMQSLNYTSFPNPQGGGEQPEGEEGEEEARGRLLSPQAAAQPIVLVVSEGQQVKALEAGAPALKALPEPRRTDAKARAIAEDAIERLVRKEIAVLERWGRKHVEDSDTEKTRWLEGWYAKHQATLMESLQLTKAQAQAYCQSNQREVLAEGWEIVAEWLPGKKEELLSVAFEEIVQ